MSNFTQKSVLKLKTKVGLNGKSSIDKVFFTPPFKIISPLESKDFAEIMILCVSAGLMKGDRQEINLHIGENSKILLSSQSYEKIHNTQDGYAQRTTYISLAQNAILDYAPLPVIPFGNASFQNRTNIYMQDNAKLYYGEIFCAGRVARGEIFAFKRFFSQLFVYHKKQLLFFENMNLVPSLMPLQSMCAFGGYTHSLSYIIVDRTLDKQNLQAKVLDSKLNAGISFHNDVIIIKALANESEVLIDFKNSLLGF